MAKGGHIRQVSLKQMQYLKVYTQSIETTV